MFLQGDYDLAAVPARRGLLQQLCAPLQPDRCLLAAVQQLCPPQGLLQQDPPGDSKQGHGGLGELGLGAGGGDAPPGSDPALRRDFSFSG